MHTSPLTVMDAVGPAVAGIVFAAVMAFVAEPTRRTLNAIILAGAGGVYLSGGFGPWELVYPALATPIAFLGLRSYRVIGAGWLTHAGWDLAHHVWGNPIWPFMPSSAFGCMVFDGTIAVWFLANAPSFVRRELGPGAPRSATSVADEARRSRRARPSLPTATGPVPEIGESRVHRA